MGSPRGFLDIDRKNPGYRPVKERIQDFNEVEKKLSDDEIKQQAARCMDCGVPFCHGCGCPLGNLVPEWNDLLYRGHIREALDLLYSTNNFPEFTGRVCPALCEAACTVGINAEPVSIRQIEISIIEKGYREGLIVPLPPRKRSGKKVAIIGSGPAGLAAADQLNHMGHLVTVYEMDQKPGGYLRYGIPDFKLDKKIVRRRLEIMEKEGVVFETSVNVGKDVSAKYLESRFDAVCLACGARQPRDIKIPGRELDGVHYALDFLKQQNQKIVREVFEGQEISAEGRHVVVIGGGDTGSDCVGTSVRQKAASVTQLEILPKPPEFRPGYTPWPQWPYVLKTTSSHEEGCQRMWSILVKGLEGSNGKISKLHAAKLEWENDVTGRPKTMKEVPGTDFIIPADLVLIAMGFTGPVKEGLISDMKVDLNKLGNVFIDGNSMTSVKGVFAAGDLVSGASLVVRAISSGRDMADKVNAFLNS